MTTATRPVSGGNPRHAAPPEQRMIELASPQLRDLGDGTVEFSGYAAVFNQRSQGLPFVEVIDPGAFAASLRSNPDVTLVLNHNPDSVIARTTAGTLFLTEDTHGLLARAILPTDDPDAARAIAKLRSGSWRSMSFLFWDCTDPEERHITAGDGIVERHVRSADIDFGDVSIVTHPAYAGTTAELRSTQLRAVVGDRISARAVTRSALDDLAQADGLTFGLEVERRAAKARALGFGDQSVRVERALEALLGDGDDDYDFYWWIYDLGPDMVVVRAQSYREGTPLESGFWQYSYSIAADGAVTFAGVPVEVLPRTVYDPVPALPAPQGEVEAAGEAPEDDAGEVLGDTPRSMSLAEARAASRLPQKR